jgi:hypothetical protein
MFGAIAKVWITWFNPTKLPNVLQVWVSLSKHNNLKPSLFSGNMLPRMALCRRLLLSKHSKSYLRDSSKIKRTPRHSNCGRIATLLIKKLSKSQMFKLA